MFEKARREDEMSGVWTKEEVTRIVDEYITMLIMERSGEPYNKSARNKALQREIGRSHGSIEFKHCNISAALAEMGMPIIDGYKPRPNLQQLLRETVLDTVELRRDLFVALEREMDTSIPATLPAAAGIAQVAAPRVLKKRAKSGSASVPPGYRYDYAARDAANRALGRLGEEFIMEQEAKRLWHAGYRALSDRIEHVAKTIGDGLGYDIRSYEPSGQERWIEVKTTRFGVYTPFFASANEVTVSETESRRYHLYRVFQFTHEPRFFVLKGSLRESCTLTPVQYRARVA